MSEKVQTDSPFVRYLPVGWALYDHAPVFSLTHSHGLKTRFHLHNLSDPINQNRDDPLKVLISYEIRGRHYDLYTVANLEEAFYPFTEEGIANIKGDLAERIARRLMKRFLQRHPHGKPGGLFDKRFNPKASENYVVANTDRFVLKIGRYPNMILLKKTGHGKWGYSHVTDLDGLFDFRFLSKRHLIIMESKIGRIDLNSEALYDTLFVPLKQLFPEAIFSYVLFANRDHLLDARYPEYRILQDTPLRVFQALKNHGLHCFFFEFNESESEFIAMCRHLITSHRTYHDQTVHFQGSVSITDRHLTIFNPGSKSPYIKLEKDASGRYQVIQSPKPGPSVKDSKLPTS